MNGSIEPLNDVLFAGLIDSSVRRRTWTVNTKTVFEAEQISRRYRSVAALEWQCRDSRLIELRRYGVATVAFIVSWVESRASLEFTEIIFPISSRRWWRAADALNMLKVSTAIGSQSCNEHQGRRISPLYGWLPFLLLRLPLERQCMTQ